MLAFPLGSAPCLEPGLEREDLIGTGCSEYSGDGGFSSVLVSCGGEPTEEIGEPTEGIPSSSFSFLFFSGEGVLP